MKEHLRLLQRLQEIDTQTKEIRKTIEQVAPKLVTTAIHLNLKHGHIWVFDVLLFEQFFEHRFQLVFFGRRKLLVGR